MADKIFKLVYISVFFALVLAIDAKAQTYIPISGTVTDNRGAVMPGVSVYLTNTPPPFTYQRETVTDADGRYTFTVPSGNYAITISAAGFKQSTSTVSATAGQSSTVDIVLNSTETAQNSIKGKITAGKNVAVGNARVEINKVGSETSKATTTGEDGSYEITGLEDGKYEIRIQADGFEPIRKTETLKENRVKIKNFRLKKDD